MIENFYETLNKPRELTLFVCCCDLVYLEIIFLCVNRGVQSLYKLNAPCFGEFAVKIKSDAIISVVHYPDDLIGVRKTDAVKIELRLAKRKQ